MAYHRYSLSLTGIAVVYTLTVASMASFSPRFFPPKCNGDRSLSEREELADIVLSGKVASVLHGNNTYACEVDIYRVMKGKDILHDILGNDLSSFYKQQIVIGGFGNVSICDSDVMSKDVRIFLLSYFEERMSLTLNSSLVRVGMRTLKRTHIAGDEPGELEVRPNPETSACKYFYCSFYAQCRLGPLTSDPYCECPSCENEIPEEICGSDGNVYPNACEIRKEACKRRKRIRPAHRSRCREMRQTDPCINHDCQTGAECRSSTGALTYQCVCPEYCDSFGTSTLDNAVCGSDNKDYKNRCELNKYACTQFEDVTVQHEGPCDPCQYKTCPKNHICIVDELQRAQCQCQSECVQIKLPVCGTDVRTYDNVCQLRYSACMTNDESLVVAYDGMCKFDVNPCDAISCSYYAKCMANDAGQGTCHCESACPAALEPVCGSDGKTYRNECDLKRNACIEKKDVTVVSTTECYKDPCVKFECAFNSECQVKENWEPECVCPTCTADVDPVCGSNGITYLSRCQLLRDSCQKQIDVQVEQTGSCGICTDYFCDFGVCHNVNGTAVCKCPEDACMESYNPVCGNDNITYENICNLTVKACNLREHIGMKHEGACEGDDDDSSCDSECLYGATCVGRRCLCDSDLCPTSDDLDTVCASDGREYKSECELKKISCEQQKLIEIKDCDDIPSGDQDMNGGTDTEDGDYEESSGDMESIFTTVDPRICDTTTNCRFDGQCDYTNHQNYGKCVCSITHCLKDDAVCGSDGNFYRHICAMRTRACELQSDISNRAPEFCMENGGADPCGEELSPLFDLDTNLEYNCTTCMADPENCDICPADSSCRSGKCCPIEKEVEEAPCAKTEYGCCPDGETLSPGPNYRGCPSDHEPNQNDTCQCSKIGSNKETCDPITFQCDCKPGVGGQSCNGCQPGWWGLRKIAEGNSGCLPCQCNTLGSEREDCDQDTGRCLCKDYATGHKCEQCVEEGHMLTAEGCVSTNQPPPTTCETKTCPYNGICVYDHKDEPVCSCDLNCTDKSEYVCGSDGQTYSSACELKRKACQEKSDVEVESDGECKADGKSQDSTKSTTFAFKPIDKESCADSPCNNDGTCIQKEDGYVCACTVFWTGAKCQSYNDYNVPHFSGNSYIKLIGWKNPKTDFHLDLSIILLNDTGVLLYAGRQDGRGDYFSLVLSKGFLEFWYNVGNGRTLLKSKLPLLTDKKYRVEVSRSGQEGQLHISGQPLVTNSSTGKHTLLDVEPELFVGGVNVQGKIKKRLATNLGGVKVGFVGCVSLFRDAAAGEIFNLASYSPKVLDGRSISQCKSDPCSNAPCGGAVGPNRSLRGTCEMVDTYNFKCTCFSPYTGETCQHTRKRTRHLFSGKLSDGDGGAVFPTPRFDGKSYLQYRNRAELEYEMTVEIAFMSKKEDGVLLYASQQVDGSGDFIVIYIERGYAKMTFDLGHGDTTLSLEEPVVSGQWHILKATKTGKNASLSLDEGIPVIEQAQGDMKYLNIGEDLYFGAIPITVDHDKTYLHSAGLHGVIQRVAINGNDLGDLFHSATVTHGVKLYKGPPCHPNLCLANHMCVPELYAYKCTPLDTLMT